MDSLLIAFNGTGNKDEDDNDFDTNVTKIVEAYIGDKYYQDGVGTGNIVARFFGGLFGCDGKEKVNNAIDYVLRNGRGCKIDVVGFSRGAALAVDFCNEMDKLGYKIRCLMVFDIVGSFGIPGNGWNLGYNLDSPVNVEYMYHAMSLDEKRGLFPLTRLDGAEEVWFDGYHSSVGGGDGCVGLNSIPLSWMFEGGSIAGISFDLGLWEMAVDLCDPKANKVKPLDLIEARCESSRELRRFDVVYHI